MCNGDATLFQIVSGKEYYQCRSCSSILLHPRMFISNEEEKKRYQEHNNDVDDIRYQKFVAPIVTKVRKKFTPAHNGLDFGAGTGPVITKILRDHGYNITIYDPYFWHNPEALEQKYDFIACCEVIEHFHDPAKEFSLLRSLLKPNGSLLCMTDIYTQDIDFKQWYYKNDQTHVFFYHAQAFQWIKAHLHFSTVTIDGRLIHFTT
ncbi:MAG: class I SAM-dependent methyltransferase [Firmicutes bacterium]|nr:class I SAM-dependent methyltransferase [Bacillota bacterium]